MKAFRFRLETSLRLADQELDIAQALLAREHRKLQQLTEQRDEQEQILGKAWHGQKTACLQEPLHLGFWQKYSREQKEKLELYQDYVEEQQKIVNEYREKLVECRIKVEKYERLKEKKLRLYYIEELRKEQNVLDEIGQSRRST